MTEIHASAAPLEQLPQILPPLLQNLSIGRSHIALEQIQRALRDHRPQIVLVTVVDGKTPIAAAIAVEQQRRLPRAGDSPSSRSAVATIVHAGPLSEFDDARRNDVAAMLASQLDQILCSREVQFVQWATDPNSVDVERWCAALGFERIAKLEYLSGSIEPAEIIGDNPLLLQPLDWDAAPESLDRFTELVARTYIDTADCPRLTRFRTARQTLDSYLDSTAFAPELWYRVVAPGAAGALDIGCLILSSHGANETPRGVIELVYMGLVPESRGGGFGRRIMAMAMDQAHRAGGTQMILAVDRSNQAARQIYHRSGFQPILAEAVWAKSL